MGVTKTEELKKKIAKSLDHYAYALAIDGLFSSTQWVDEILKACKEAGLAFKLRGDDIIPKGAGMPGDVLYTHSWTREIEL